MKYEQALEIINKKDETGFMVSFAHKTNGFLYSDHFPSKYNGEKLIETEEEAWDLAKKFAAKTKNKYINIYVVTSDFSPVKGYKRKFIKNR